MAGCAPGEHSCSRDITVQFSRVSVSESRQRCRYGVHRGPRNGIILTTGTLWVTDRSSRRLSFTTKNGSISPHYILIHDFTFYKFDPACEESVPRLSEIPLRPQCGRRGQRPHCRQRCQVAINTAGTLARLDREPPGFAPSRPNDFNTHYYQASTAATHGFGFACNRPIGRGNSAQRRRHAQCQRHHALLYRVKRALELLRRGETVSRGSFRPP